MYSTELYMNEKLQMITYVLSSGYKGSFPATVRQAKEIFRCFEQGQKIVFNVGDETYAINPDHVASMHVHGLNEASKSVNLPLDDQQDELAKAYHNALDLFKIECKCSATYVVNIKKDTEYGKCNACKEKLFVDRSKGRVPTYKGDAWIMTNKTSVR
ncbi:hypothetical protein E0485_17955 [Paenibacillus albiflavus]|uniref:Uncharacterized protein n=1 Tax=Paenibacillus albiflavus TaxID=2545760 RepID=A0A4R4E6F8_9BACL|nr:hypothetical protein [Paenibacillus albiflavus]TCZ75276.1 hypothetical protein E0485_17955 [Paenibacillus albiflavus]